MELFNLYWYGYWLFLKSQKGFKVNIIPNKYFLYSSSLTLHIRAPSSSLWSGVSWWRRGQNLHLKKQSRVKFVSSVGKKSLRALKLRQPTRPLSLCVTHARAHGAGRGNPTDSSSSLNWRVKDAVTMGCVHCGYWDNMMTSLWSLSSILMVDRAPSSLLHLIVFL